MERLRPNIVFDFTNGTNFFIDDLTGAYDADINPAGYGTPNTEISDVNAVRFIFGSYLTETEASESTTIEAGREYKAIGTGTFTFDTKSVSAGETFIFMSNGTPTLPSTLKIYETGRFSPATNFVPIDVVTGQFTPSLLGIDNPVFPDSIYSLQMNTYTTSYSAQNGIPDGSYIVYGEVGQTVTIGGVEYRINEVFTQLDSFDMTGDANIALFNTTTTDEDGNPDYVYFLCGYHAWNGILSMQNRLVQLPLYCSDKLRTDVVDVWNKWQAILSQLSVIDGPIDISGCQILLDEINQIALQP